MTTRTFIATVAAVVTGFLTIGATAPAAAQETLAASKKGQIHLTVNVKAGSVVLEPGMYQITHAVEGSEHFVTFNEMNMPAGYRHSNTPVAKDASARIACKVEPLDKKAGKTTVTLRTNASGGKEVAEVQIAGEPFKHVF
jgi:hypothetical protein